MSCTQSNSLVAEKLRLEDGLVTLPPPEKLQHGWMLAPSCLPDTTFAQVQQYLMARGCWKGLSWWEEFVFVWTLERNQKPTRSAPMSGTASFEHLCVPEQRVTREPYDVWVSLHKDSGEVIVGDCQCVAG